MPSLQSFKVQIVLTTEKNIQIYWKTVEFTRLVIALIDLILILRIFVEFSHNLDDLKQEVSQLNTQLRKLLGQLVNAEPEVRETFEYFVEVRPFSGSRIRNIFPPVRTG